MFSLNFESNISWSFTTLNIEFGLRPVNSLKKKKFIKNISTIKKLNPDYLYWQKLKHISSSSEVRIDYSDQLSRAVVISHINSRHEYYPLRVDTSITEYLSYNPACSWKSWLMMPVQFLLVNYSNALPFNWEENLILGSFPFVYLRESSKWCLLPVLTWFGFKTLL